MTVPPLVILGAAVDAVGAPGYGRTCYVAQRRGEQMSTLIKELLSGSDSGTVLRAGLLSLNRAELRRLVSDTARSLEKAGVRAEHRALLRVAPGVPFVAHLFALLQIGAQPIVVDHRIVRATTSAIIEAHGVSWELFSPRELTVTRGFSESPPRLVATGRTAYRDNQNILLQLSSGTTDDPKLVGRREEDLRSESRRYRALGGVSPEGTALVVAGALASAWGLNAALFAGLGDGHEVVLPTSTTLAGLFAAANATGRMATILAVPMHVAMLARVSEVPRSLVSVLTSGGPVSEAQAVAVTHKLGVMVGQVYGSTETGLIAGDLRGEMPGTSGSIAPSLRTRLLDGDELAIAMEHSPYVNRADNEGRWESGWFRTHDAVTMSVSGQVTVHGRIDGLLSLGGRKFHIAEIEHHLTSQAEVEAAVVFLHDSRIEAFVVPRDSGPFDRHGAVSELAEDRRPHVIRVVNTLPLSPSGKILRQRDLLKVQLRDQDAS